MLRSLSQMLRELDVDIDQFGRVATDQVSLGFADSHHIVLAIDRRIEKLVEIQRLAKMIDRTMGGPRP